MSEIYPSFRRYETIAGIEYEVLSSKKTCYYTVQLLAGVALDCQCRHIVDKRRGETIHLKARCRHMVLAEQEEAGYQIALHIPYDQAPISERGVLTRHPGFKLLRSGEESVTEQS